MFIAFFLYFLFVFTLGIYISLRSQDRAYVSGNHSFNYWVTAVATQASDMSSWLFMGYPAIIYLYGLEKSFLIFGLLFFTYLNWTFVAPKLRFLSEKHKIFTLPGLFQKQFLIEQKSFTFLCSFLSIFFFILYISANLVGLGRLLEAISGFSYGSNLVFISCFLMGYMVLGGYMAVTWVDFFQGIFLFLVITVTPIWLFFQCPYPENIMNSIHYPSLTESLQKNLWNFLEFGLGYFGQSHILAKFMTIKNKDDLKKAKRLGLTWQFFCLMGATSLGLIAHGFFPYLPKNPELIFQMMVEKVFSPFYGGLILCGLFAATLSTLDGQLLVITSTLLDDLKMSKFFKKNHIFQIVLSFSLFFSSLIAYIFPHSVFSMVRYAWSGLGGTFGPLLLTALYFPRLSFSGGMATLLVGASSSLCWSCWDLGVGSPIPSIVVSFASSCLCILIFKTKDKLNQL